MTRKTLDKNLFCQCMNALVLPLLGLCVLLSRCATQYSQREVLNSGVHLKTITSGKGILKGILSTFNARNWTSRTSTVHSKLNSHWLYLGEEKCTCTKTTRIKKWVCMIFRAWLQLGGKNESQPSLCRLQLIFIPVRITQDIFSFRFSSATLWKE